MPCQPRTHRSAAEGHLTCHNSSLEPLSSSPGYLHLPGLAAPLGPAKRASTHRVHKRNPKDIVAKEEQLLLQQTALPVHPDILKGQEMGTGLSLETEVGVGSLSLKQGARGSNERRWRGWSLKDHPQLPKMSIN